MMLVKSRARVVRTAWSGSVQTCASVVSRYFFGYFLAQER